MIVNNVKVDLMERAVRHLGGTIVVASDNARHAVVDGQIVWCATPNWNGERTLFNVEYCKEMQKEEIA